MLSNRFKNDGKATLALNDLQLRMRNQIQQKVDAGEYKFEEVSCGVCNGNSFEKLSEKDRYGLYMPVVICQNCGLVQTNPRMNQSAYNHFYNTEYRKLYVGTETPISKFFDRQFKRGEKIFRYIFGNTQLVPKELYVLEVGCGAGGILKYFADSGCQVKGCDLGEEYTKYGRKHHRLDLEVGTLEEINIKKKPEVIIYSHTLEHILDVKKELEKIHSVLDDKGIFYIEVPGVKNIRSDYQTDFLRFLQNAHTYHFTLTSLKNLLQKNNFALLCGNEQIESIFTKSNADQDSFESDYRKVMDYLSTTERYRIIYMLQYQVLLKIAKAKLIQILDFFGLREPIKRLLRRH